MASVQEYMRIHYGTIYDKRGNIVWRWYEEEDTWWEPANPVDPVNWLISRAPVQLRRGGVLLRDNYPVHSFYRKEWVADNSSAKIV